MAKVVRIDKGRKPRRLTPLLRRMTPELLGDIIRHSSACVLDQKHKCPLILFTQVMCWEINQAMGCPNEEDAGFRRCSDMLAAKPIGEEHLDGE